MGKVRELFETWVTRDGTVTLVRPVGAGRICLRGVGDLWDAIEAEEAAHAAELAEKDKRIAELEAECDKRHAKLVSVADKMRARIAELEAELAKRKELPPLPDHVKAAVDTLRKARASGDGMSLVERTLMHFFDEYPAANSKTMPDDIRAIVDHFRRAHLGASQAQKLIAWIDATFPAPPVPQWEKDAQLLEAFGPGSLFDIAARMRRREAERGNSK